MDRTASMLGSDAREDSNFTPTPLFSRCTDLADGLSLCRLFDDDVTGEATGVCTAPSDLSGVLDCGALEDLGGLVGVAANAPLADRGLRVELVSSSIPCSSVCSGTLLGTCLEMEDEYLADWDGRKLLARCISGPGGRSPRSCSCSSSATLGSFERENCGIADADLVKVPSGAGCSDK
jgi:hypothetical protein